jgi:hypothetical protein
MKSKTLLHLHLQDGYGNKKTLICTLKDGRISYTLYGSWGSSGVSFSLSNIQFYDRVDGRIHWKRGRSLPVENLEGETLDEFKSRVINMIKNSTLKIVKEVSTEVTFK